MILIPGEYTNGRTFIPMKVLPENNDGSFKNLTEKQAGFYIEYKRENNDFDSIIFYGTNYRQNASRGLFMEVLVQE